MAPAFQGRQVYLRKLRNYADIDTVVIERFNGSICCRVYTFDTNMYSFYWKQIAMSNHLFLLYSIRITHERMRVDDQFFLVFFNEPVKLHLQLFCLPSAPMEKIESVQFTKPLLYATMSDGLYALNFTLHDRPPPMVMCSRGYPFQVYVSLFRIQSLFVWCLLWTAPWGAQFSIFFFSFLKVMTIFFSRRERNREPLASSLQIRVRRVNIGI